MLTKDTIDDLMNKCLDGKRIGDMIPHERFEHVIRNYAYPMKLISNDTTEAENLPYRLVEATKQYAGTTQYDPSTRQISNYKAGFPFAEIDNG